jgi:hypothetical protein
MGIIKVKNRTPKKTDFAKGELVVDVKNGNLFFKSNKGVHKLISELPTQPVQFINQTITYDYSTVTSASYYSTSSYYSPTTSSQTIQVIADSNAYNIIQGITPVLQGDHQFGTVELHGPPSLTPVPGINQVVLGMADGSYNSLNAGSLSVNTSEGYVLLGPQSTTHCHFETDLPQYFFNKGISVDTGIVSAYDDDLILTVEDGATATQDRGRIEINKTVAKTDIYGDLNLINNNSTSPGIGDGNLTVAGSGSFSGDCDFAQDSTHNSIHVWSFNYNSFGFWNSDKRLKKNIISLKTPLNTILNLKGVNFEWDYPSGSKEMPEGTQYGFIAQEVEKVDPNLIEKKNDKLTVVPDQLAVDMVGIIPILVEAIKDQQKQIDELKEQLK